MGQPAADGRDRYDKVQPSALRTMREDGVGVAAAIIVSGGRNRSLGGGPLADVTALIEASAP